MTSVRELAQRDVQRYNAKGSDSILAQITDKIGNVVEVGGRASSHNQSYDSQDGAPVNQPQSNITFSMTELTEKGLSFRNARKQVEMNGWVVEWVDLGKTINGTISETKPDESMGLIVCFIQENKI